MEHSINMSNVQISSHLYFNQADKAVIEMKNPEHFGWKFDGTRYIAIVTDNRLALDIVISFASCRCKGFFFCLCLWGGRYFLK